MSNIIAKVMCAGDMNRVGYGWVPPLDDMVYDLIGITGDIGICRNEVGELSYIKLDKLLMVG